ncbi:MAG: hypothetical protein ABIU77_18260 [Ferruginibacter sp.]
MKKEQKLPYLEQPYFYNNLVLYNNPVSIFKQTDTAGYCYAAYKDIAWSAIVRQRLPDDI